MKERSHQLELALTNEAVSDALPAEAITECRQLIGQMLCQVLLAEKEVRDESR